MAIVKLCNGIITGLQADAKPTTYPNGTKLITTDDGREWKYVNSEWVERDTLEFFDAGKRTGAYLAGTGSATPTVGSWDGMVTAHTLGSFANGSAVVTSTGVSNRWSTGTTINSIGGGRVGLMTERDLNPWTIWKFSLGTAITNVRMFCGYRSSATAAASSADPLANLSGVGFWFDTGVHATNIAIMQNSGGASSDKTTIPNVGTMVLSTINTYEIRAVDASSKWQYRFNGFPNGAWADINTVIPAATTDLGWVWFIENLDTVAHLMDVYYVKTKQDA